MPFITFIYKVGNSSIVYFGKYYTDYISDDHNGLDLEVKYVLLNGINKYRTNNNMPKTKKISIGVLSCMEERNIPIDSTRNEIKCFDFYYDYDGNVYVNGKIVK